MKPKIVELPELKLVGFGTKFISILSPNKNNHTVIPALWGKFMAEMPKIQNRTSKSVWGVVEMLPVSLGPAKGEMHYMSAAEVADVKSAPSGMISRTIPAGKYASFTHKGKLDTLAQTMKSIFTDWLPKAGLRLRSSPQLELYDQRFIPDSDASEFDILLPVE